MPVSAETAPNCLETPRRLSSSSPGRTGSLAVCVFHHVPPAERDGLVAEMVRQTKPGGLVVEYIGIGDDWDDGGGGSLLATSPDADLIKLANTRNGDSVRLGLQAAAQDRHDFGVGPRQGVAGHGAGGCGA